MTVRASSVHGMSKKKKDAMESAFAFSFQFAGLGNLDFFLAASC